MKPLVIYHGNCADGFSAAWCFHHYKKDGYDFHAGVYGKPPPDVTGRIVYLVDFSYKRAVVEEMLKVADTITLIDHHKTAVEELQPLFIKDSWMGEPKQLLHYCDMERSGVMLAWDYLFNRKFGLNSTILPVHPEYKKPPLLLEYIQDRDLWKFRLQKSREISASVFSYEYSFEQWDQLMLGTSIVSMCAAGEAIERKHHKDIKELLKVCMYYENIGENLVPVANMPYTMASDAGSLMAKNWQNGEVFAATFYDTADTRNYSLRSCENGLDVGLIAAKFGGGGHKHAAGFKVPLSDIREGTWGYDGE